MIGFVSGPRRSGNGLSSLSPKPPRPLLSTGGFAGRGAFSVGLVVVTALAASAQESETLFRGESLSLANFVSAEVAAERETAEDMAVMAKLVDQSVAALYASAGGCAECHGGVTGWHAPGDDAAMLRRAFLDATGTLPSAQVRGAWDFLSSRPSSAEGISRALWTYLPGYGVVYQLEAPAPVAEAEAAEEAPASCTFLTHTPWQRADLQLRGQWNNQQCLQCHAHPFGGEAEGETGLADAWIRRRLAVGLLQQGAWHGRATTLFRGEPHHGSAGMPTRSTLVKTLLDVLAENGHNFQRLAPEERVTVAMTFRRETSYWQRMQSSGSGFWGAGAAGAAEQAPENEEEGGAPRDEQDGQPAPDDSSAGAGEEPSAVTWESNLYLPQSRGVGTTFRDVDNDGRLDVFFANPQGGRLYRNLGDGRFEQAGGVGEAAGQEARQGIDFFDYDNDGDLDLYISNGELMSNYDAAGAASKSTHELAGDLHMRQGNYSKAVEAYEKAIRQAMEDDPSPTNTAAGLGSLVTNKRWADILLGNAQKHSRLYNKLIQALVGAGRFDEAKQLIEFLRVSNKIQKKPDDGEERPARNESAGVPLPARLVVSATKAQLDAVHAGAMSREEFAQQATVRFADPNAAEAQAAGEVRHDEEKE